MHWMPAIFVVLLNICRCHQKNVTQKNTVFFSVYTFFYLNAQRELYVKKPMKNIFLAPNTKMGMVGVGTIQESSGFKY